MEILCFIAGAVFGALVPLGMAAVTSRRQTGGEPLGVSPTMRAQWENFARYDGTEKGQANIE